MATDWAALRAEYINGTDSMRGLAEKHSINPSGVMRRAAKECWEAARKQESAKVSAAALDRLSDVRVDEIVNLNAADLEAANMLRGRAAEMAQVAATPSELNALSNVFVAAQKIGRLALGATTENSGHSSPNGGPVLVGIGQLAELSKRGAEVAEK